MNVRSMSYFLQEGFRSFWINGLMSIASVVTVTLCLVLFGIYLLFSANVNHAADQLENSFEIRVHITVGTPGDKVRQIGEQIKAIDNVGGVVFFSKAEAFEEWKTQFEDKAALLEGMELDNPLPDAYKVTLEDLTAIDATIAEINKIQNISSVKNYRETIDRLVSITSVVRNISLWFMIFFALISVFIISNAIRLTVFARRREVNIMKFVGATDLFISLPFTIEGIIIGVISAILSLLLVTEGYHYIISYVANRFGSDVSLLKIRDVIWQLIGYVSGLGVTLGAVGSMISLRRHLHV